MSRDLSGPSLADLFVIAAREQGADVAIVQERREVTYAELMGWAETARDHLVDAGAGPGEIVAVEWLRAPESVAVVLGVLMAGAAFLPLRDSDPPTRRGAVLADAGVRLVILCRGELDRGSLAPGIEIHTREELLRSRRSAGLPGIEIDAGATAYVIATSGSTGVPKAVAVPHRGVVNHIAWERSAFAHVGRETFLQNSPLAFDASIWEIFTPLCAGARLAMLPESGGHADTAATVTAHDVTTIGFVPTTLEALLEGGDLARCSASLQRVVVGGETLHRHVVDVFERAMGDTRLINVYGATEATIDSTWQLAPFPEGRVTVGKPIANTRIDIVDDQLRPVPHGTIGEILIAGVGVADGYLARPSETARSFLPDPRTPEPGARLYRTGDMGRLLPDGTLDFIGRRDTQVKVGGVRIELGEIEAALTAHPRVSRAVALTVQRRQASSRLVAVVVAHDAIASSELQDAARAHLPAEMIPSEIRIVQELPTTASGKVDRPALAADFA